MLSVEVLIQKEVMKDTRFIVYMRKTFSNIVKMEILTNKFHVVFYISILSQNAFQKNIYLNFNPYRIFNN